MEYTLAPEERIKYLKQYKILLEFYTTALTIIGFRWLQQLSGEYLSPDMYNVDEEILTLLDLDLIKLRSKKINVKDQTFIGLVKGFYGLDQNGIPIEVQKDSEIPKGVILKGAIFNTDNILLLEGRIFKGFQDTLIHIEPFLEFKDIPTLYDKPSLIQSALHVPTKKDIIIRLDQIDRRSRQYFDDNDRATREAIREMNIRNLSESGEKNKTISDLLNPSKINIIIYWNLDYAVAKIGDKEIEKFTKNDLKPKPWNRLAEFAHKDGRLNPPNPYRAFDDWQKDYEKKHGNPPDQRDKEHSSKRFKKEQEAWIQITKRLRTALKKILSLSKPPFPKEKKGPYKSLFKSINISDSEQK